MKYKAIFFDRDGTLTYYNPEKIKWRDEIIESWSGHRFDMTYEKMMHLFEAASQGKRPWYKTLDDEKAFFKRYYRHMLDGENVHDKAEERAELLFSELWCSNDRLLFDDVIETLDYFKQHGYKMGVISDTSPSLEYSLQQLSIAKYFSSFTASSLVGASKPSPIIFNAALSAQGVSAEQSIYVDDYKPEADGARALGFTSFLIDRTCKSSGMWTVSSLSELINFVESINN